MRKKVIAGNWKMNKTPAETEDFFKKFVDLVEDTKHDVVLCVPYVDLMIALDLTKNTKIKIGAQNMHFKEEGAFTGEVSPKMLKAIGVEYVIIGHSERRTYYNETDESVNLKIKSAISYGLKPIVCVGETLEQRESGVTKEFVISQIKAALKDIESKDIENIIIAYEPIWAIGTGRTASSQDANEVCEWIRNELRNLFGSIAENVVIQYGGSVKSSNAKELFSMSDIDGGLVGGASLDAEEFAIILNC